MTEFRVSCTVRFFNGAPAPNIDVTAHENGGGDFHPGRTGADGRIDALLRNKRTVRVLFWDIDDLFDNPSFTLNFRDAIGRTHSSGNDGEVILPEAFGPDDAATTPTLIALSPAALADSTIRPLIGASVPGYAYMIRRNGTRWVDATRGLRVVGSASQRARAMTRDTILHLASMSKSITVAALAAMLDDWSALNASIAQIANGTAPVTSLRLVRRFLFWKWRKSISVPTVLLPLFFDRGQAVDLGLRGLLNALPAGVRGDLATVASGSWGMESSDVPVPPGYFGLLRRVLKGDVVPNFDSPFLPLIRDRLGAGASIGAGMGSVKLSDLVCHRTNLSAYDGTRVAPWEAAQVAQDEPADGGLASVDYWGQTRLLLRRDAVVGGNKYLNENYTILTTVIDACTEEVYDTYLNRRLFFDARFDRIRRHVAVPGDGARYYAGAAWTGGVLLPDYTNWPGNGGHYASVSQLTDWLHVLYSRTAVASVTGGSAPLITAAAHAQLFTTGALFAAGNVDQPIASTRGYSKNGGTGPNGGFVNGKMGIYVSASGAVYAIAFVMNGQLSADPPFDATVNTLAASSDWT